MQTNCPVVFLQQITTKLNEPKGPLTFVQILQWTVIFQQRHRKIPIFNEKMTNRIKRFRYKVLRISNQNLKNCTLSLSFFVTQKRNKCM